MNQYRASGHSDAGDGSTDADELAALNLAADALDKASTLASHYEMAVSLREALGVDAHGELPNDLPALHHAALLAFEYFVETTDGSGRSHITLVPRHTFDGDTEPPLVRNVSESVVDGWRLLVEQVAQPAARARLHHLLFQRGGRDAVTHARNAAAAYVESAAAWTMQLDAVDDLVAAARLARAVKDGPTAERSMDLMVELVAHQLDAGNPLAGVILRALSHLVSEDACPASVDDLLERTASAWPDGQRRDGALALMLKRCADESQRAAVWERRVQAHIDQADAETTAVMRSVRLAQALAIAEASGIRSLRERAAGLLQAVRGADREMIRFNAASRRYEEEFERLVDAIIAGDDWRLALISFATFGPISGDTETNRRKIENDHRIAPFARLFPVQLTTPEGLPLFSGSDEGMRFDVDLVTWEQQLIDQHLGPMTVALHEIGERHGLPTQRDLASFLNGWPGVFGLGQGFADVILRYWAGDPEGAAYIITPMIEALVRNLVLATDTGIYRLQKNQAPGQYPGLGVLLPLLAELYDLPESRIRFLSALLTHPAGVNLRNRLAHGYVGGLGAPIAALLIHAALGLAAVSGPVLDAP